MWGRAKPNTQMLAAEASTVLTGGAKVFGCMRRCIGRAVDGQG